MEDTTTSSNNTRPLTGWVNEADSRADLIHRCIRAVDEKMNQTDQPVLMIPLRESDSMEEAATLVAATANAGVGKVYVLGLFMDSETVVGIGRTTKVEGKDATSLADLPDEDAAELTAMLQELYEENEEVVTAPPEELS